MRVTYGFLDAEADQMPGVCLPTPMAGLWVQPTVGYWSDRTWLYDWFERRQGGDGGIKIIINRT